MCVCVERGVGEEEWVCVCVLCIAVAKSERRVHLIKNSFAKNAFWGWASNNKPLGRGVRNRGKGTEVGHCLHRHILVFSLLSIIENSISIIAALSHNFLLTHIFAN